MEASSRRTACAGERHAVIWAGEGKVAAFALALEAVEERRVPEEEAEAEEEAREEREAEYDEAAAAEEADAAAGREDEELSEDEEDEGRAADEAEDVELIIAFLRYRFCVPPPPHV